MKNTNEPNEFKELYSFIERAEKNRKIATNTAYGLKAAAKLFDENLTDEEQHSIELVKERLDAIYSTLYQRNKEKMEHGTLEVYKRRISKLIDDFEKYGIEPSAFTSWSSQAKAPRKKKNKLSHDLDKNKTPESPISYPDSVRNEIPLQNNRKAVISIPQDFNKEDARRIKVYAEYLEQILDK
ncbi:MAG: hypothetical protein Q8Q65_02165 [bacterium]|nr:hypothetical protein [bacterium]